MAWYLNAIKLQTPYESRSTAWAKYCILNFILLPIKPPQLPFSGLLEVKEHGPSNRFHKVLVLYISLQNRHLNQFHKCAMHSAQIVERTYMVEGTLKERWD